MARKKDFPLWGSHIQKKKKNLVRLSTKLRPGYYQKSLQRSPIQLVTIYPNK